MADKISGAGGSTTGTDLTATPAESDGVAKSEQTPADELANFVGGKIEDAWEEGQSLADDFEDFVADNSKDGTLKSALREKGKSVLEMMADRSQESAKAEAAKAAGAASGEVDPTVGELTSTLASTSEDLVDMDQQDMAAMLNNEVLDGLDSHDRMEFAAQIGPKNRAEFADQVARALMDRGDIPSDEVGAVRDKVIEATEDLVLHAFEHEFIDYTAHFMNEAKSTIQDKFNADSSSRREVLASFAEKSGDPQEIAKGMVALLSIPKSDAEGIAEQLAELHGDSAALTALRSGEEGPGASFITDGDYLDLEQDLESALDDAADNMDDLVSGLRTDQQVGVTEGDHRVLADGNFKTARKAFLQRMGDVGFDDDTVDALQAMAEEEAAEAEENMFWENVGHTSVMIASGLALSVMTGGAGTAAIAVGVAGSAAGSAPSVVSSWNDAELAEQAHAQGQTDAQTAEAARDARNKAIATTIASMAFAGAGAAGSKADPDLADVAVGGFQEAVVGFGLGEAIGGAYDAAASLFE